MTKTGVRTFPSIQQLTAVVERLDGSVSQSRRWQLASTVKQLGRALADGVMPHGSKSRVEVLLGRKGVDVFLDLAQDGRWREDPSRGELSWASIGVMRDCLKILGREAGVPGMVLPRVWRRTPEDLTPTIPEAQRVALYRRLVEMAAEGPLRGGDVMLSLEDRARLLAMVAVVLDTGARASELVGMRLGDLSEGEGELVVRRRPQNAAHLERVVETHVLRPGTGVALRRWLVVREGLVARVTGERVALWVSLQPAPGQLVSGLPLRRSGLERAYRRGVAALNVVMAGEFGWVPLPSRLEVLRRSVGAGVLG